MGSIRVIPSGQGDAPVPLTVFTFKPGAFTVGEAGAPANRGAAFRMYVEASETPDIHTGIAVTNMSGTARNVILELFDLNGAAFMSRAINLGASSQFVNFLDDTALFPNMPKPFQGVLRISAPAEISVVGLRGRTNERNEFLITTTPPALESTPATSAEMLFPHLVNGGGYTTQFNLFSGTVGQTSSGTLRFYRPDGTPLSLNLP